MYLSRRLLILRLGFLLLAGVSIARLYRLQITEHKVLAAKAETQYKPKIKEIMRGAIFDRRGRELAVSLPVESAYLVPAYFRNTADLNPIAGVLEVRPEKIQELTNQRKSFVWLKRRLSPRQKQELSDLKTDGIGFVTEKQRFYPKKTLASHLIGFVGVDGNGLEGLEFQFERYLTNDKTSAGYDLILTVDENIQEIAQRELTTACEEVGAKGGCVIVMEPGSGEILALANYPHFNPNSFERYSSSDRRNRAITDVFEPGSTMKVFVAAAALEEKLYTPSSKIWCEEGEITLGETTIKDTGKYGDLTLTQVLTYSSNVGAIKIGLALGRERLYKYLRNFGFGERSQIDFPGEAVGILRSPQAWSQTSCATIAIGQEIGVTVLQMVSAMAAVANDGYLVRPRLVKAIKKPENSELAEQFAPQVRRRVISQDTARSLNEILQNVVENGTGTEAALPNIKVAGKTGTAQKIDPETGAYSEDKVVASFIGYLPAQKPQLVILAMVDEPQVSAWGSKVAAPLFRKVADQVVSYSKINPYNEAVQVAHNRW
ncbi:MAG: serine hydrolase [Candidatus Schekmanbacteria bacterium]|nr:serine hydrolase [Candidatus Schekmanbacteria bacterium]